MKEQSYSDKQVKPGKIRKHSDSIPKSLIKNHLTCIGKKQASRMCVNQHCKQNNVFECSDESCPCRNKHVKCKLGSCKNLAPYLHSKIIDTSPLSNSLVSMINKKIDQLASLKRELIKETDQKLKYVRFNDLEKKVMKIMEGEIKVDQLKSQQSKQIWQLSNLIMGFAEFDNILKTRVKLLQKLQTQLHSFDKYMQKTVLLLKNDLAIFINTLPKLMQKQLDVVLQEIALVQKIANQSAICKDKNLAAKLKNVFGNRIHSLEYIFCASKHDFRIKPFFKLCGSIKNTVVLCKTNSGKIVGGFTPLNHDKSLFFDNYGHIADPSGESFIFELSQNQKYVLKNKERAIYRKKQRDSIIFGEDELIIGTRANMNQNSEFNAKEKSYVSKFQTTNNDRVNENFRDEFKSIQWQVWKVQLKDSQKDIKKQSKYSDMYELYDLDIQTFDGQICEQFYKLRNCSMETKIMEEDFFDV